MDYQYDVRLDQRSCLMANRVGWNVIFHQENDADGDDVTAGSNSDMDEDPASAKHLRQMSCHTETMWKHTHTHSKWTI